MNISESGVLPLTVRDLVPDASPTAATNLQFNGSDAKSFASASRDFDRVSQPQSAKLPAK